MKTFCLSISISLLTFGLYACGEESSSTQDIVEFDAEVEPMDPLFDFCQAKAERLCEWAFDCVGASPALATVFGLDGPSLQDCIETDARTCTERLQAWDARGTLNFAGDTAANSCLQYLEGMNCLRTAPDQWVDMWRTQFVAYCGNVASGNVPTDGACTEREDCALRQEICANQSCSPLNRDHIRVACETPAGADGTFAADASCPTGFCVNSGYGGMCSLDCTLGTACVGEQYACIEVARPGNTPSRYCAAACSNDGQCGDLVCRAINPAEPDNKYCIGTNPLLGG